MKANSEQIGLLGNGWVCLLTQEARAHAIGLIGKMESSGLPAPTFRSDSFCRLDLDPQHIFLDRELFSYELHVGDRRQAMSLRLRDVETFWGTLSGTCISVPLSKNVVQIVRCIESGKHPESEEGIRSGDIPKQMRDTFHVVRGVGLRMFLSTAGIDGFKILVSPS